MYHKLIYDLKLLDVKYEDTPQSQYISKLHNMLLNEYPLEEVVEHLLSTLHSFNTDKDDFELEEKSYSNGYTEGWNDTMSEIESMITYKDQ